MADPRAAGLVAALAAVADATQRTLIEKRLGPGDTTAGIRMRDLFDVARQHAAMPLPEVAALFDDPRYEVRMSAVCILDVRARGPGDDTALRERLHDLYLAQHDRITTWDMVDRAAPSVLGGHALTTSPRTLHDLAATDDVLRRRSAVTAPLWLVRYGDADALADAYAVASLVADDPDPLVARPVGTLLKHAGARDPDGVRAFLDRHREVLPPHVVRAARSKLPAVD